MSGATGLNYPAVESYLNMKGASKTLFCDIQIMERAALSEMRKKDVK